MDSLNRVEMECTVDQILVKVTTDGTGNLFFILFYFEMVCININSYRTVAS